MAQTHTGATRSRPETARKRTEILQAAIETFGAKGSANGTLADIAEQVHEAGLVRSAVILVGRVLAAQAFPDSHLYSAARDRHDCTSSQVLP